jgi:hypothetical protein
VARKHLSSASLFQAHIKAFAKMNGTHRELVLKSVQQARRDLHKEMSGSVKTDALRKMGHPYGRGGSAGSAGRGQRGNRRGRSSLAPNPINWQSGTLRRSIYLTERTPGNWYLGSSAPYAKYQLSPDGTKGKNGKGGMIRRGVFGGRKMGGSLGRIERYWRARNRGIREALKRQGF